MIEEANQLGKLNNHDQQTSPIASGEANSLSSPSCSPLSQPLFPPSSTLESTTSQPTIKVSQDENPNTVDTVNTTISNGLNSSNSSSNQMPYRKQSVFVAPAGLNWIINENSRSQMRSASQKNSVCLSPPSSDFSVNVSSGSNEISDNESSCISCISSIRKNSTPVSSTSFLSSSNKINTINSSTSSPLQSKANVSEIEKHISKIISENAAIVETLDPLWSKKSQSRHSISSVPSGHSISLSSSCSSFSSFSTSSSSTILINATTSTPSVRRYSEIIVDPSSHSASKLQSALLGKVCTTSPATTCSKVVTGTSTVPSSETYPQIPNPCHLSQTQQQPGNLFVNDRISRKYSEPFYPSVIMTMKQANLSPQKDCETSLVKKLLTLTKSSSATSIASSSSSSVKVISVPANSILPVAMPIADLPSGSPSAMESNTSSTVHPENPEGSIIKDLLLKARGEDERKLTRSSIASSSSQEELTMLVYVCTICKIAFRNKETLEAHQQHYCKANEPHNPSEVMSSNQLQLLNDHVQRKISVMESNFLQNQLTRPLHHQRNQVANGSSNPVTFGKANESLTGSSLRPPPPVGNILKQQLLSPYHSPPLKKRKSSEPVFSSSIHYNSHNFIASQNYDKSSHSNVLTTGGEGPAARKISAQTTHANVARASNGNVKAVNGSDNPALRKTTDICYTYGLDSFSPPVCSITFGKPVSFQSSALFSHPSSYVSSQPLLQSPSEFKLEALPDYYPYVKYPKTKITLSGPVIFPVLRKILAENSENIEFQVQEIKSKASISNRASDVSDELTIYSRSNNFAVYKQVASLPEMQEDFRLDVESARKCESYNDRESVQNCYPIKEEEKIGEMGCVNLTLPQLSTKSSENQIRQAPSSHDLLSDSQDAEVDMNGNIEVKEKFIEIYKASGDKPNASNNGGEFFLHERPRTLALTKKLISASRLIGSTLISPDTPRPKRKCMQFLNNGSAYSHMGLKLTTRPTFCCIYRPQPMYVPQEAKSKLSMYSNWQILTPHDEIFTLLSPGELFNSYETRRWIIKKSRFTLAPSLRNLKMETFISTPSSVWLPKKRSAISSISLTSASHCLKSASFESNSNSNKRKSLEEHHHHHSLKSDSLDMNSLIPRKTSEDRCSTMSSGFDSDNSNDPNQPKRVKIFEGGFKSNEDYTYVRGRGRGKYVCEECGIRCKKPSMLKKHIRTHTDLRPYSCRHCAFAFKTKGNLTKHMKSKAHHKKCVELGIIPVPTTIDESQIDGDALAKQEAIERSYGGGNLASDDEENDPDDEDGCEEDEDEGSDDEGVPIPIITASTSYHHPDRKISELEPIVEEKKESASSTHRRSIIVANEMDEQEVARSLLVLSGSGEWTGSLSTSGDVGQVSGLPSVSVDTLTTTATSSKAGPVSSMTAKRGDMTLIGSHHSQYFSHQQSSFSTECKPMKSDSRKVPDDPEKAHMFNPSTWGPNFNSFSRQRSHSFNDGLIRSLPTSTLSSSSSSSETTAKKTEQTDKVSNSMAEQMSTDDSNDSESDNFAARRYSMSVIHDRSLFTRSSPKYSPTQCTSDSRAPHAGQEFTIKSSSSASDEGPIDLSKRNGDCDESDFTNSLISMNKNLSASSSMSRSHHNIAQNLTIQNSVGGDTSLPSDFSQSMIGQNEEGKSVCRTCHKTFSKLSQLRLHVNIHYLERPFRCESCGVSFRTKGHLQKHERSVSHFNKVNINLTFGTPTTDNPRPFKCDDCIIAFRIHGHLAKHLRSKAHIMKLECSGKLPCGMYADMERFGISLNEIDTNDCENSLQSLQLMAEKMYSQNGEIDLSYFKTSSNNGNGGSEETPGGDKNNNHCNNGAIQSSGGQSTIKNNSTDLLQPISPPIQRSYSFSESNSKSSLAKDNVATKRLSFSDLHRHKMPSTSLPNRCNYPPLSSPNLSLIASSSSSSSYHHLSRETIAPSPTLTNVYGSLDLAGINTSNQTPMPTATYPPSVIVSAQLNPPFGPPSASTLQANFVNSVINLNSSLSSHTTSESHSSNPCVFVSSSSSSSLNHPTSSSPPKPPLVTADDYYSLSPAASFGPSPVKAAIMGSNVIATSSVMQSSQSLSRVYTTVASSGIGNINRQSYSGNPTASFATPSSPYISTATSNSSNSDLDVNCNSNLFTSSTAISNCDSTPITTSTTTVACNQTKITPIRSNTCHYCNQVFKSAKFLQVHLYCDHQQQRSSSPKDIEMKNNENNNSSNVDYPMNTDNELKYSCEICRKSFTSISNLQKHLLSHSTPRPYVCDICDAGFTSSSLLASHLPTHSVPQTQGLVICHECGLKFTSQMDFHRHLQLHVSH